MEAGLSLEGAGRAASLLLLPLYDAEKKAGIFPLAGMRWADGEEVQKSYLSDSKRAVATPPLQASLLEQKVEPPARELVRLITRDQRTLASFDVTTRSATSAARQSVSLGGDAVQANFGDSASNSFPDILFPSTNSTFQLVFSGVADKTYVAQPSAVVTERGTFLVAARVGATHQGDAGDIYLLECALDGTMLATNMVYHDADGFDARNAVLFKTSQNTLLLAFDLFEYIHSTWPTNSLRMMRSTDWGAHWISTNTLPCIGTNCSTAGEMVQCTDGRIILPYFQLVTNAPQWTAWAQTSTNDGISWGSDRMLADLTGADVRACNEII